MENTMIQPVASENHANPVVIALKVIALMCFLITYVVVLSPFLLLERYNWKFAKTRIFIPSLHIACRIILFIMNIKIEKSGDFNIPPGTLILSNHQSYFDLFVTNSIVRSTFICAQETAHMPIVGLFVRLGGCLFIDRNNKARLSEEIDKLTGHLDQGVNVGLCPESKCTDGTEMIRFRRPFFRAPVRKKADIFCATINYTKINGEPVTRANKDHLIWYRNKPVPHHFFSILKLKNAVIHCQGDWLRYDDYSRNVEVHVADQAHALMSSRFRPLV